MARYLVTGGAGFIGSHIVEALVRRGDQVTVLDDFSSGRRENLAAVRDRVTVIEGDIRDRATVARAMDGIEVVLHQAALRSVPKSLTDPAAYHAVNVTGTFQVLLTARDARVRRVIMASSSSVYGETDQVPQREEQRVAPLSPYAASKLLGELYCQLFTRTYGLETVCLRYFNVFGPRQSLENAYAVVIPQFIVSLLQGQSPPVHGDGLQSRDFTYIDNVVAANLLAAASREGSGQVVNVGCGERYSILELFQAVQRILKSDMPPTHTPPRAGDVRHTQADIAQAQRLIGYRPLVTFTEGLERTAAWFAAHASRS